MYKSLKTLLLAGALVGSVGTASAAVLDFTANNATGGTVQGTANGWSVTGGVGPSSVPTAPATLVNTTHGNRNGCGPYACAAVGNRFDVGFGINGANGNEIDGPFPGVNNRNEFVEVRFDWAVRVTGFAGLLIYAQSILPANTDPNRERMILEYRTGNGPWQQLIAEPLFRIDDPIFTGTSFDTVGLARLAGISVIADTVRFRASGLNSGDDRSFNGTAGALEVSTVPVPAAGFLLIGALGGLAALRRRKAVAA